MAKALDKETIQKIIDIYTTENISIAELTKRVGLKSESTVSKYLKLNNIHIKSVSELIREPETVVQIIRLHSEGYSEDKLEKIFNLTRVTLRKILHENGIKTDLYDRYRTYNVDQDYFATIDTNNKAYVLGMLYADGNVSKNKFNLQLSLRWDDKEILEKISQDMKSDKPLYFRNFEQYNDKYKIKAQNQWCLTIHSKKIHQDLEQWGVVACKTHILTYPNFLTDEQHSHFLRGNIDGDGCIHSYNGHNASVDINGTYEFCFGAKEIIEHFVDVHCSLIPVNFKDRKIPTYRTIISGRNQVIKFLNWLYKDANLYMQRKYNIYIRDYKDIIA